MTNAILIHGWNTEEEHYDATRPSASNDHWYPWLTKQLILQNIHTVALEMPGYLPDYAVWKRELERFDIDENTVLVGHSCGAGFLVRWLSENDVRVGKVFLVAPWLGYGAREIEENFDESFFEFTIDRTIAQKTQSLHLFYSSDDVGSVQKSVQELRAGIDDLQVREFADRGHFTIPDPRGAEFPELLDEILSS